MKIIDTVKEPSYVQWVEKMVEDILRKAKIMAQVVTITYIELSRRVYLDIDGKEYTIRTWNFHPVSHDKAGRANAEVVDYTLFKCVKDHGEVVDEGSLIIMWTNEPSISQARSKVAFIVEGSINGNTFHTHKFNDVVEVSEDGEEIQRFTELFQMMDATDFEKCPKEERELFILSTWDMVQNEVYGVGSIDNSFMITAIDEETDIFQWGIEVTILDEENYTYSIIDWKKDGYVFKFADDECEYKAG